MKKLICTALAAVMLLSATACGKTLPDTPTVSTTSSETEKYGDWLADRLGYTPENVVLGIGNDAAYGIDLSNFENDGYIIRTIDGMTTIFGKTADGLDRGVRKYALATERGEDVTLITYHEGYRIEELRIFGVDISEYVIEYDGTTANENMKFAASELRQLVKKACGAELEISETATDAAHKIILRHSKDEELRFDGYRYFAENGNLVIEGAVARGCMYGVYRFLQNECGWEGLSYIDSEYENIGESYLNEAELIDIPSDISKSETPFMEYMNPYHNFSGGQRAVTDRTNPTAAQFSYGTVPVAMHGMQHNNWDENPRGNHTVHGCQACYTEEGGLDVMIDNICAYIEGRIAAGAVPGESLKMIDISQGDNNRYCYCADCSKVMEKYKSVSATVVYGANYIAEAINEMYPSEEGIGVQIFAYFASKIPPSSDMEVNENVYITFAQNGNCSNHPMDGSECKSVDEKWSDPYLVSGENITHDEWLRGWCALSDNVYVWYYALDKVLQQYTVLDILRRDFAYMKELGVAGFFMEAEYYGFGITRVEHTLAMELWWNPDMTEEEYEEKLSDILERDYGEGWQYLREYIDLWIEAADRIGCHDCWGYGCNNSPKYDAYFMVEHGDTMVELMEKMTSLAGSAKQEYRAKILMCHVYYTYICGNYFVAYEAEDTEKIDRLSQMYLDTLEFLDSVGYNNVYSGVKLYPTLEQEAWLVWVGERVNMLGYSENLRPAPEVEDIYAEPEIAA